MPGNQITTGRGGCAYLLSTRNIHDLIKGLPAVIFANGVTLFETDMIIRRNENADGVSLRVFCHFGSNGY